ncbi:uncharacterized protein LOC135697384 [Ochlerotatus camptorhynchus]|uniref:uncharacterized protein LOC135697384 n=1 Tax=Ochlerotatus camptorhynchus TaxID=644619 RepID=UPI0031D72CFF
MSNKRTIINYQCFIVLLTYYYLLCGNGTFYYANNFYSIAEIFFIDSVCSESPEQYTIRPARRPTEVVIEEDDENTEEEQFSLTQTVDGFRFPLKSPEMVEQLENVVRKDSIVRKQYVELLRKQRDLAERPTFAFLKLFKDKALLDYNYSGRCNFSGSKKKAMKDYCIFVECINEAWGGQQTAEELRQYICSAITLINNRKRGARFRSKQRNSNPRKK